MKNPFSKKEKKEEVNNSGPPFFNSIVDSFIKNEEKKTGIKLTDEEKELFKISLKDLLKKD